MNVLSYIKGIVEWINMPLKSHKAFVYDLIKLFNIWFYLMNKRLFVNIFYKYYKLKKA
jgi:hypothetical protein